MRVYYDRDADINLIKDKKVVIVGYGSQGRAHALNLKDSGCKNITVALREGSATARKAEADDLPVKNVADAAKDADLIMMCAPAVPGNISQGAPGTALVDRPVDSGVANGV